MTLITSDVASALRVYIFMTYSYDYVLYTTQYAVRYEYLFGCVAMPARVAMATRASTQDHAMHTARPLDSDLQIRLEIRRHTGA